MINNFEDRLWRTGRVNGPVAALRGQAHLACQEEIVVLPTLEPARSHGPLAGPSSDLLLHANIQGGDAEGERLPADIAETVMRSRSASASPSGNSITLAGR